MSYKHLSIKERELIAIYRAYPIQISYKTIYRAIYAEMFDTPEQKRSEGNRGAIRRQSGAKIRTYKKLLSNSIIVRENV